MEGSDVTGVETERRKAVRDEKTKKAGRVREGPTTRAARLARQRDRTVGPLRSVIGHLTHPSYAPVFSARVSIQQRLGRVQSFSSLHAPTQRPAGSQVKDLCALLSGSYVGELGVCDVSAPLVTPCCVHCLSRPGYCQKNLGVFDVVFLFTT